LKGIATTNYRNSKSGGKSDSTLCLALNIHTGVYLAKNRNWWWSIDTPASGMAYADHLLSYRSESSEDLIAEKAALKAQRTIYSAQGMGTKSMQRDLRLLEERLQAINFVLKERTPPTIVAPVTNFGVGISDFSTVR
jgi:hypothetical protein